MMELLNSPQVRVVRLRSRSARTSYCVKYCGKAAHKFQSVKRYWQSPDYDTYRKQRIEDAFGQVVVWDRRQAPLRWIVAAWLQRGWIVNFESPYRATASPRPPAWGTEEGSPLRGPGGA